MKESKKQKFLKLMQSINYQFTDLELLTLALTHKSHSGHNNERLEFLGDSVLNYAISSTIYTKFPKLTEGELTRIRSKLVSREALIDLAKDLSLSEYIILGDSERTSGGMQRKSILANTLEAIFGAIFIDANIDTAKNIILNLYKSKIATVGAEGGVNKDPKTELQEWLQAREHALPEYIVIKTEGKPHKQIFFVECRVNALKEIAVGSDTSIRKAEQLAASKILAIINKSTSK